MLKNGQRLLASGGGPYYSTLYHNNSGMQVIPLLVTRRDKKATPVRGRNNYMLMKTEGFGEVFFQEGDVF
ncbi:hypothetical protein NO222_14355 [Gluconacetobacter entanii]|nr:hypothetical protein [Gluconacetobacter entanii]